MLAELTRTVQLRFASSESPFGKRDTDNMFRFSPITNAKQIQRRLEHKRNPISTTYDRPQLVFVLCKDRYESLSDTHEIRYRIFWRIVLCRIVLCRKNGFAGVRQDIIPSWGIHASCSELAPSSSSASDVTCGCLPECGCIV